MSKAWIFQDHRQRQKLGDKAPWSVGYLDEYGHRKSRRIGAKRVAEFIADRITEISSMLEFRIPLSQIEGFYGIDELIFPAQKKKPANAPKLHGIPDIHWRKKADKRPSRLFFCSQCQAPVVRHGCRIPASGAVVCSKCFASGKRYNSKRRSVR
jgi:hypothetical protein